MTGNRNFEDMEWEPGIEDFVPSRGEQRFLEGEPESLTFAKYPLNTPSGIWAAWSFISDPDNAAKYDQMEVEQFKERVRQAARHKGVDLPGERT